MLLEQSPRNPLVDGVSNVFNQFSYPCLILFLSPLNSFEEELYEAFQRVLIHVINDA